MKFAVCTWLLVEQQRARLVAEWVTQGWSRGFWIVGAHGGYHQWDFLILRFGLSLREDSFNKKNVQCVAVAV